MDTKMKMRLSQWAQDLKDQMDSGLSRKVWCEAHNINTKTFDYRCRRVQDTMAEIVGQDSVPAVSRSQIMTAQPTEFAQIHLTSPEAPNDCGIQIRLDHATIHIAPDSNTEHVRLVMEALSHAQ